GRGSGIAARRRRPDPDPRPRSRGASKCTGRDGPRPRAARARRRIVRPSRSGNAGLRRTRARATRAHARNRPPTPAGAAACRDPRCASRSVRGASARARTRRGACAHDRGASGRWATARIECGTEETTLANWHGDGSPSSLMRLSDSGIGGCFPTGRHYPGIADRLARAIRDVSGLCAAFDPGAPWMELPMAVIDFETTGRDAEIDRVIEVGIVGFDRGEVTFREGLLVDPERPIPA